jgi:hypothetical protein
MIARVIERAIDRADIARVLDDHPTLTYHGNELRGDEGGPRSEFHTRRKALLDAANEVSAAFAVLKNAPRDRRRTGLGSYKAKNQLEVCLEVWGRPMFVSNGAAVVAALLADVPILQWGLNPRLDIPRRWLLPPLAPNPFNVIFVARTDQAKGDDHVDQE